MELFSYGHSSFGFPWEGSGRCCPYGGQRLQTVQVLLMEMKTGMFVVWGVRSVPYTEPKDAFVRESQTSVQQMLSRWVLKVVWVWKGRTDSLWLYGAERGTGGSPSHSSSRYSWVTGKAVLVWACVAPRKRTLKSPPSHTHKHTGKESCPQCSFHCSSPVAQNTFCFWIPCLFHEA